MKKKITHDGKLDLGGLSLDCYILEDGTRVLSGRGMQVALNMVDSEDGSKTSGARLNRYLGQKSLQPFIYKEKESGHYEPLECYQGRKKISGYEATILVDICDAFLDARNKIELSSRQLIIAKQCEILVRSFAKIGIIALVDEATGYQYERERDELQIILKAYIAEELLPWQKRFPDIFYKELFRLNGWDFTVKGIKKRPGVVGTWTNKYIYKQLPNGVLEELKKLSPKDEKGKRKNHLHRRLSEGVGHNHLDKQLTTVITIMKLSKNWKDFNKKFNNLFGQTSIDFPEDE